MFPRAPFCIFFETQRHFTYSRSAYHPLFYIEQYALYQLLLFQCLFSYSKTACKKKAGPLCMYHFCSADLFWNLSQALWLSKRQRFSKSPPLSLAYEQTEKFNKAIIVARLHCHIPACVYYQYRGARCWTMVPVWKKNQGNRKWKTTYRAFVFKIADQPAFFIQYA